MGSPGTDCREKKASVIIIREGRIIASQSGLEEGSRETSEKVGTGLISRVMRKVQSHI